MCENLYRRLLSDRWISGQLAAALLFICAACASRQTGSSGDPAGATPSVPAGVLAGMPGLPTGDSEPPRRVSSDPIALPTIWGDQWYAASPTVDDETVLAAGGRIAYALYEIPIAACQLQELELSLYSVLGGAAWVALPDYESGCWEFDGPLTVSPPPYDFEAAKRYSPQGRTYVAVIAWNGSQVAVRSFEPRVEAGDPIITDVADVGGQSDCDIASLGGLPVIAFHSEITGALHYARASVSPPAGAADWEISEVDQGGLAGMGCALGDIAGLPVIAYGRPEDGSICFAWASTAMPDDPSDWQRHTIATGTYAWPSLTVLDGQPLLGYYENDTSDADSDGEVGYLCIAVHAGTDYSTGWNTYRAKEAGNENCGACLNQWNGLPAVSFVDISVSGGQVYYGQASGLAPASAGAWDFQAAHDPTCTADFGRTSLAFFDGHPAILFRSAGDELNYAFAAVPANPNPGDWHWRKLDFARVWSEFAYDMTALHDVPAILCTVDVVDLPYLALARFPNCEIYDIAGPDPYNYALMDCDLVQPVFSGSVCSLGVAPIVCFTAFGKLRFGRVVYETGN